MVEDKARDRVESGDSGRERNAVFRPQGPDAARMDFFNGLLRGKSTSLRRIFDRLRDRKLRADAIRVTDPEFACRSRCPPERVPQFHAPSLP